VGNAHLPLNPILTILIRQSVYTKQVTENRILSLKLS